MKKLLTLIVSIICGISSFANHITGGTIYYTVDPNSPNGNNYTYHVTLLLYRDFNSLGAQLDDIASIAVFDRLTGVMVYSNANVSRSKIDTLWLTSPSPCISNPPVVKYQVGHYDFNVTLPGSPNGYIISYQRCCRITGINNILGNSANVGATYTAEIPGTSQLPTAPKNNSARFFGSDTVVVCANNSFCYNFGADDPDTTDHLTYSFCNAFVGGGTAGTGGQSNSPTPSPPAAPAYSSIPYNDPFKADAPMGDNVTLNTTTGMMCGRAPAPGIYVVTVCVSEFRNGVLIATQRKDLQIKVGDCSPTTPSLDPQYITCDGFTLDFFNHNANPLVHTYQWYFGDGNSSSLMAPSHTYVDSGTYNIKLVVNQGEPCSDSATSIAKVYPGFFPNFYSTGVCINKPSSFFDSTVSVYGAVDGWRWDFGDGSTNADTSRIKNPTYVYSSTGVKNIRFIVSSSKGCIDTVYKDITIIDKPILKVNPKDTLICNGDNVQLQAIGIGVFSWTGPNMVNQNSATPTVNPSTTTNYFVQLDDNGCINRDTVRVRVVNFVTLSAMKDTVICLGDSVRLTAITDGLRFNWTPASTISNPTLLSPNALPVNNPTTYQLTAIIGSCNATDDVTVSMIPYPGANAGPDTVICYNTTAFLHASMVGSAFSWSPSASLSNPNSLNTIASPPGTTSYVLSVTDVLGCPKPKRDTVVVTVLPKVNAFAGKDTAVVVGQPLHFNATGGVSYSWSPSIALNNPSIFNPTATYDGSFDSIVYKVVVRDQANCSDSDFVLVKIFRTNPQIFVPTAFTPNGDGHNDFFRPIPVGISRFEYFRVYNRWGQLVYSSVDLETGWDGKIQGRDQASNTFVWVVKGVDYTGKEVFAKGTVTLIR